MRLNKNFFRFLGKHSSRAILINLFLLCFLFQIYLVSRQKAFYGLLKILFVSQVLLLLFAGIKLAIKHKAVLLLVLFVFGLRLPFYFMGQGMITTSDNAVEALQCQEIQDSHLVPFYLQEAIRHIGTWKYLFVAYVWDFFGRDYLFYLLLQLGFFFAFLYLLHRILKPLVENTALRLFLLLNFVFIETVFDYSLSIRGGPYLEMVLFILLGISLFDFDFKEKKRIFLSFYFLFWPIYLHPLAGLFAVAFIICTFVYALNRRRILQNILFLLGGFLASSYHLIYYALFFKAKPVHSGTWDKMSLAPLSSFSFRWVSDAFHNFQTIFRNIFSFEFSYLVRFFPRTGATSLLEILNQILIFLSLIIFIFGAIFSLIHVLRLSLKKEKLTARSWLPIFFLSLLLSFLGKLFFLSPSRVEPRHNFEVVLLIILSYMTAGSLFFKPKKWRALKAAGVLAGLLLLSSPNYLYFFKGAHHRHDSYAQLMSVLKKNGVRYLDTDFNIAYTVHFLSGRAILVSNKLGPLTLHIFFPEMRAEVDQIPDFQKAFLLYSGKYLTRSERKGMSGFVRKRLFKRLKENKIPYKIIRMEDFSLVIPSAAETRMEASSRGAEGPLPKPRLSAGIKKKAGKKEKAEYRYIEFRDSDRLE